MELINWIMKNPGYSVKLKRQDFVSFSAITVHLVKVKDDFPFGIVHSSDIPNTDILIALLDAMKEELDEGIQEAESRGLINVLNGKETV